MSKPEDKFVQTALPLFAARGFYGTSLADVAAELGLTKQAIIYHFKTKEKLYGAVLARVAKRLDTVLQDAANFEDAATALHRHMQAHPQDARLIARELLDNLDRAAQSQTWYLRSFLDSMTALLLKSEHSYEVSLAEARAAAYQVIGAIHYFAVSQATLSGIWGDDAVAEIQRAFPDTLTRFSA